MDIRCSFSLAGSSTVRASFAKVEDLADSSMEDVLLCIIMYYQSIFFGYGLRPFCLFAFLPFCLFAFLDLLGLVDLLGQLSS